MITTLTGSRTHPGLWLVPTGLVLLSMIPVVIGGLRLTELGGGPEIIPANPRFAGFVVPVISHIISATIFSMVGALQFLPALRRGKRSWHSIAGRSLIPAGIVVALSGLWLAAFLPHPAGDGTLLLVIRLTFGSYMVLSLLLAIRALARRSFVAHGAWMTRAYALGVAAGTQAITVIPGSIVFGDTHELSRAVAIGVAWFINLAVAELVIYRRRLRLAERLGANHPANHHVW